MRNRYYPRFLTAQRLAVLALIAFAAVADCILLSHPVPSAAPSTAEIAVAVNGPAKFQRPSAMEFVAKTNSCVVGGTVTTVQWHLVGTDKVVGVGGTDPKNVDYTTFGFRSDAGRQFVVSAHSAVYNEPGENLGLELDCDPATMDSAPSFGMVRIIYGGK